MRAGRSFTIHCPNPGAMSGCADPGSRVWYSQSSNANRKYACTLEIVETSRRRTGRREPEPRERNRRRSARGATHRRFRRNDGASGVGDSGRGGRFDFRLDRGDARCYVEVKSVTLSRGDGLGAFPDAKSDRARRHVMSLQRMRSDGHRAVLFFCVQHNGIERVTTADDIDPAYGDAVRARASGRSGSDRVSRRSSVSRSLTLADPIPVCL